MSIKIDISPILGEVKSELYKTIYNKLCEYDFEEMINEKIKEYLDRNVRKMVQMKVYEYMEESEIALPENFHYNKKNKITLNDFVIRIVRESMSKRLAPLLDELTLKLSKELNINIKIEPDAMTMVTSSEIKF